MAGARPVPTLPSGEPRPRYDVDTLLEVAVTVFTERGYDGTSMEDLSRASGLSKSSLYHHIRSKEGLLRLALDRAIDPLLRVLGEPGAQTGAALERLRYVIDAEIGVLEERLPYATLLLRVHGNTQTERWALEQRRRFDHAVAALLQEAIDAGEVRSEIDAGITARLIFGMINSLVEWQRAGRQPWDSVAAQVETLVLDGIRS